MTDIFDTTIDTVNIEITQNRLVRGEEINVTELDPAMKKITIGVGWDLLLTESTAVDLDISVFALNINDKTRKDSDFVFYNNLTGCDDAVVHNGDNRTGAGDGDDETISIDLQKISFDVSKLVFVVSIYKGEEREQGLSKLRNSYIRLFNEETLQEYCRYDYTADVAEAKETAMLAAHMERQGGKWYFKALGEFVEGGLGKVAKGYDIIVQMG